MSAFQRINLNQGTHNWAEWRKSGIGSSDAPSIMGENPWKSADLLLKEKLGLVEPFNGNYLTRRGQKLEPVARRLYSQRTGIAVEPATLRSTRYTWQIASVDGLDVRGSRVVEIKCGAKVYSITQQTGNVPRYYYGQLQHILSVTGLDQIDFVCFLPDKPLLMLDVPRDDRYIRRMFEAEEEFWEKMSRQFNSNVGSFVLEWRESVRRQQEERAAAAVSAKAVELVRVPEKGFLGKMGDAVFKFVFGVER